MTLAAWTKEQEDRGRRLVNDLHKCKQDLGELALEVVPGSVNLGSLDYQTSPESRELERFAEVIGIGYGALRGYRRVSLAYAPNHWNPENSWAIHYELATHPDRHRLIQRRWTVRKVRDFIGKAPKDGPSALSSSTTPASLTKNPRITDPLPQALTEADRVQLAREVLADPKVAPQVFDAPDPATRTKISKAARDAEVAAAVAARESLERQAELEQAEEDPAEYAQEQARKARSSRVMAGMQVMADVKIAATALRRALDQLNQILRESGTGTAVMNDAFFEELDNVGRYLDAVRETARGETVDAALARLLGGEV